MSGWAQSGPVTTGNPTQGFKVTADLAGANVIQTCSLLFTVTQPDDPNIICRPEAEIIWSVAGHTARRLISIADGLVVSGQAESCSVRVYDGIIPENCPPAVAGREYQCGVLITPGARPPNPLHPPTFVPQRYTDGRLEYAYLGAVNLNAKGFVAFDVPPNAGVQSVIVSAFESGGTALGNGDVQVSQMAPRVGVLKRYSGVNSGYIPLAPGTAQVAINHLIASDLIVSLAFGIDG